jgi:hypothetical protein
MVLLNRLKTDQRIVRSMAELLRVAHAATVAIQQASAA